MRIIAGNILDTKEGIIAHQVNCQKVAGAGLAKQIRDKWPAWYRSFMIDKPVMGTITTFTVSREPQLYVANLYAQFGYGTTSRHTDYVALRACLNALKYFAGNRQVYLPYGVGCALGGGDWQVVSKMIDEVLPMAVVVKLDSEN